MDGAEAGRLYSAIDAIQYVSMCRRAWRLRRRLGVSLVGAASSADLGGSSKYSSENLEGRGGEGFHVNSN